MTRSHKNVEILIVKLEQSMRNAGLWSSCPPSSQALHSTVPFAYDSMSFVQWLQFIFIPKMSLLVSRQGALPVSLELLPMAEQYFASQKDSAEVMAVIKQIDLVFTDL